MRSSKRGMRNAECGTGERERAVPRSTFRIPHSESGLSVVEATIILAVLAILTSVLAPSMGDFVNESRQASVKSNLDTLCTAVEVLLRDTGETFLLRDAHASSSGQVSRDEANRVAMLVGDGRIPDERDEVKRTPSSKTDWSSPLDNAAVQRFSDHLIENRPAGDPTKAYRTGGQYGWRGAYIGSGITADPWGYRFAANVEFLGSTSGTDSSGSGSVNSVIVLSAGPNGVVETRFAAAGVARGGDDQYCVVAGATQ